MIDGLMTRKAGLDDAAAVAVLLTELNYTVGAVGYPEPFASMPEYAGVTPEKARSRPQRVAGVETVLLAEVFGEPAGFTSLRLIPYLDQDTPYAEVTQMHARPQFRRHRIGEALIAEAERLALIAGATCVHIITGQDNPGAQAFYTAMGYEPLCVEFEKFISVPLDPHPNPLPARERGQERNLPNRARESEVSLVIPPPASPLGAYPESRRVNGEGNRGGEVAHD